MTAEKYELQSHMAFLGMTVKEAEKKRAKNQSEIFLREKNDDAVIAKISIFPQPSDERWKIVQCFEKGH